MHLFHFLAEAAQYESLYCRTAHHAPDPNNILSLFPYPLGIVRRPEFYSSTANTGKHIMQCSFINLEFANFVPAFMSNENEQEL